MNTLDGLAVWLRRQANTHAASICANDPVVKAEIATLRAWATAVDTIASPAKMPPVHCGYCSDAGCPECAIDETPAKVGGNRWVKQTTLYDGTPGSGNCAEACIASLFAVSLDDVQKLYREVDGATGYWMRFSEEFEKRGYEIVMMGGDRVFDGMYLADGPSSRGCSHMVVIRNGELLHDPHPSGEGLRSVQAVHVPVPLDPARAALSADGGEAVKVTRSRVLPGEQIMTFPLPEGGKVTLTWPEGISSASIATLSEMLVASALHYMAAEDAVIGPKFIAAQAKGDAQ